MDLVVCEQVVHHARQERNVTTGPDRRVMIRHGRRPREPRIDHHQFGATFRLGLSDPLETARMCFCGVATHDPDDVRIADVRPVVGHCTAPECWSQTGHRRGVSNTSLVL